MPDDIFDRARKRDERRFGNIGESSLRGPVTVDGGNSALRGTVTDTARFNEPQLPDRLAPKLPDILKPRGRLPSGGKRRLGGELPSILTRPFDKK